MNSFETLKPEEKKAWNEGGKAREETEKAQKLAAKALAEKLTDEQIEAGLKRAAKGRRSDTYKSPDLGDQERMAA